MVLALAMGMILLLALYLTLNTHVYQVHSGREILDEGTLVRSILTRIANDVASQLGPVDPRVLPDFSSSSSSSSSSNSSSSSSSSSSSGSTSGSSMNMNTGGSMTDQNSVAFNVGVRGDDSTLILSMYQVQPLPGGKNAGMQDASVRSDLRRIVYWIANSGTDAAGLARREFKQATGNDIDTLPSGFANQNQYIIAPEVKSIRFEYFDGKEWQSSWDGSVATGDIDTPAGPPAAIRIEITLRRSAASGVSTNNADNNPSTTYQHVIALPAGNNFAQQTAP